MGQLNAYDSDESVNAAFLCSTKLKLVFIGGNSNVIQMDITV